MSKAVQRLVKISADQQGEPPKRIHLMSSGHWHTPYHGAFEMTLADLYQMVANFNNGVGLVEGSKKVPINYGHDISGKAAAWIVGLEVIETGNGEGELWASEVEWTPNGARMVADGEFKYISPEWNPRDLPWENPEVEGELVENVFTGAGLTNIPLFKKLKPVMASVVAGSGDKSNEGEHMLKLEEIRVKKLEDLNDEEKAFLAEHKAELTDDERKTFGLEDAPEEPAEQPENPEVPEHPQDTDAPESEAGLNSDDKPTEPQGGVQASAGKQGVTLTAEEVEQLRADAKAGRAAQNELLKTRLTASIDAEVARGAIKADQRDEAVEILMASSESQRDRLTKFMASLPSNELIGAEKGKGVTASTEVELTPEEKQYAADFNLTSEEVIEHKKSKEIKE